VKKKRESYKQEMALLEGDRKKEQIPAADKDVTSQSHDGKREKKIGRENQKTAKKERKASKAFTARPMKSRGVGLTDGRRWHARRPWMHQKGVAKLGKGGSMVEGGNEEARGGTDESGYHLGRGELDPIKSGGRQYSIHWLRNEQIAGMSEQTGRGPGAGPSSMKRKVEKKKREK